MCPLHFRPDGPKRKRKRTHAFPTYEPTKATRNTAQHSAVRSLAAAHGRSREMIACVRCCYCFSYVHSPIIDKMSLLRTSLPVVRRSALSAARAVPSVRGYADKPEGEFGDAYRRGESSGFSKREQASEDKFVREQEQEKLKALREKLKQQRQHLDDVEKAIDDLHKK